MKLYDKEVIAELDKFEPLRDLFDLLCSQLRGYNKTDELFDFEYKNYIYTVTYRNNQIKLADSVDVVMY